MTVTDAIQIGSFVAFWFIIHYLSYLYTGWFVTKGKDQGRMSLRVVR